MKPWKFYIWFALSCAAFAPVFAAERASTRVLYVEAVYEPGSTPAIAEASYWRDRHALEKICVDHGGAYLRSLSDSSLPLDNGDGSWKVQLQACVSDPAQIQTTAFYFKVDGIAAFDAQ